MIVTGLRGVGKTVLLGEFRRTSLGADWTVCELEVHKRDELAFRRQMVTLMRTALFELSPKAKWSDRMKRAAAVLRSFSLSVDASGALTASLGVDPRRERGITAN